MFDVLLSDKLLAFPHQSDYIKTLVDDQLYRRFFLDLFFNVLTKDT